MIKPASLVILAFTVTLGLAGCDWSGHANDAKEPYLHKVMTLPVEMRNQYRVEREFAGEVQAGQSSLLGFEFPGQLDELLVNVGDRVESGQLLAQMDVKLLESQRDELQAQRSELSAELDTAQRNLDRIKRLQAENLASEREMDDLTGRTRVLQASLQRIDASLQANQVRFDKAELRAPFAATVAERRVDTGVVVQAGVPVFSLVQDDVREVRSGIPVSLAKNLHSGDRVTIRTAQGAADGEVISVGPVVDQATRSRTVRVRVTGNWTPGELAYLALDVPMDTAGAWLPDAAVTEGVRGTWVVYAAIDDGDATALLEARSVVIHHVRGNQIFVSGALADGERVVAGGLHRLAPGQRVRVSDANLVAQAP